MMKKILLMFLPIIFVLVGVENNIYGKKSDEKAPSEKNDELVMSSSPFENSVFLNVSKSFYPGDVVKEKIQFVNTVHSSCDVLLIEGGTFLEGITNDDGVVKLYGGSISKDLINNRGAVYINGKNEVSLEGTFKSLGKPTLSKHRNATNGVRITVGKNPFKVLRAVFDEYTEINVVLTDDRPILSVIDVETDLYFGSSTIFNFEKINKFLDLFSLS